MGTYLNPGNSGFEEMLKSDYVDKTGLISIINSTVETKKKLTCICRPRRFGKSFAAQMLCAYYDKSCDSHELFDGLEVAKADSYKQYLNAYDVIYLDMTGVIGETTLKDIVPYIKRNVADEIKKTYPDVAVEDGFAPTLVNLVQYTGNKIVMIIDEWDAPIREAADDPGVQKEYLEFLRSLFKNSGTTSKIFAAAYMTGILPIKKDGSQSAISDFREYSVLTPGEFAGYVGFTEEEVLGLCKKHKRDFEKMKKWYDGYTFGACHSIYNPYSVMHAVETGVYASYWKKTSAAETLMTYIDMDQEGLQDTIAHLITGESVEVKTDTFRNDVTTFTSKDDVLTLLIHLGYLSYETVHDSYDEEDDTLTGLAAIPNEEVRTEFEDILRRSEHKELIALVKRSDKLLEDTLEGRSDAVASQIEAVHESEYAPTFYNDEQSLRYVVKMAYISAVDQYAKVEELPSGHGIADLVFLPKRRSSLPAMIVELKWDVNAEGAIRQIKDRNYPRILKDYGSSILLVGINYDKTTKKHTCKIEKV